jgi:hypothetical protein
LFDLGPGIDYDEVKSMLGICEAEDAAKLIAGAFGVSNTTDIIRNHVGHHIKP